uniref:Parathyroid hormone-related protein-like n=2 Tax=Neolamprologus brichardi TaxID=32507 RepID=A0A3Q4H1H8_NEOBR
MQKMQTSHRPVQWLAVMLLVIVTTVQGQQSDSRRAVTEHQLMHDRGRTIQSLKRLYWLSSAIEGLHTAQTHSATFSPTKVLNLALNPELIPDDGNPQNAQVRSLLRDFLNLYLSNGDD